MVQTFETTASLLVNGASGSKSMPVPYTLKTDQVHAS
jgi:hypothetical protein